MRKIKIIGCREAEVNTPDYLKAKGHCGNAVLAGTSVRTTDAQPYAGICDFIRKKIYKIQTVLSE